MRTNRFLSVKKKSLLKINDDDIFRELNKFKRYVENYCGIQKSSAEKGLGPNIAVKLARQVKDAKGVESFCINTQPMLLAGYVAIKEVFFFWI